jgi:hypothetical protein
MSDFWTHPYAGGPMVPVPGESPGSSKWVTRTAPT